MFGWILIIFISGSYSHSPATAVFEDEVACKSAIVTFRRDLPQHPFHATCVPQSTKIGPDTPVKRVP